MKTNHISNLHKGYEEYYSIQNSSYNTKGVQNYLLEENIELNENEIVFTATLKVSAETKAGRKILRKMIETQTSPIKSILQSINADDRAEAREGHTEKYTLPENILNEIRKDGEIKKIE